MALLVLASLCAPANDAAAQGGAGMDRAALLALYNATDGPNWTDDTNWLSDEPLSAWHGVTTDADGRVTELNLEQGKLSGSLPPEIGDLENLRVLNLAFNGLSGPIPPEIADLENLRVLNLAFNGLSGPIPPEIANLGNLRDLELGGNGLTGSIPPELGNMTSLEFLSIWGNFLTGSVPPELGNLASLGHLDLGNNELTGPIPAELANTSLTFLSLYWNELTGTIPSELSALTGLRGLDLERNDLSGPIPPWLGELTALSQLELGGNQFTGDISVLGELDLDYLELDFNEGLTGPLPPGLLTQRIWRLKLAGTMVCVPADEAFQDWVATIEDYQSSGLTCGEPVPEMSTIDVALFYTPAARREAGGAAEIEAAMDLWVAEANQAYIDSAVKQQIALVAIQEVDYTEVDVHTDLWRLTNLGDGHLDEVHEIRDEVGADLVHLVPNWVDGYGACGKGWIVEPLPFAVTVYACGGMAFTHELGHNMGLQHDRYSVCGPNAASCRDWPFRYAYGYVNQRAFEPGAPESARWLTIMAYHQQCSAEDVLCQTVPRFSNPGQTWNGDPLGVPGDYPSSDVAGPADAARVLNLTRHSVAALREVGRVAANRPPVAVGALPDRTLYADGVPVAIHVDGAFHDPDGDALTYSATSSAPAVVAVRTEGTRVTLTPNSAGAATISVTASDRDGSNGSATLMFSVTVRVAANRPPVAVGALPDRTLYADGVPVAIHVDGAFHDPDGDALTYSATSSAPAVVAVRTEGTRVTLTPNSAGAATISVTASDRDGSNGSATLMFSVTVRVVVPFTDPDIRPGTVPVRAVHFRELRERIDLARARSGLAGFGWTDPALTAGVSPIRSVHVTELRAALDEAYAAAGLPRPAYTDARISPRSTVIRAAHVMELRAAVLALERTPTRGAVARAQESVGASRPGGLFTALAPSARTLADPPGLAAIRTREVALDFDRLAHASAGGSPGLELNLFDDVTVTGIVERRTPTFSGGHALSGRLAGVEQGTMTLVVNGDVVAGSVRTPTATYRIRPAGAGRHAVIQIDPSQLPSGAEPVLPRDADRARYAFPRTLPMR